MPYVLIIHEVNAYAAWKAVFDQAAGIRKNAGEKSYQLLRTDDDPDHIVHFSEWDSLENARKFFESPELVEIRKRAGVKAPHFIYLNPDFSWKEAKADVSLYSKFSRMKSGFNLNSRDSISKRLNRLTQAQGPGQILHCKIWVE